MKKKQWFYIAVGCLALSVVSLFSSVVIYTDTAGAIHSYSIIDLLSGDGFRDTVLARYTGPVIWKMGGSTVSVISAVAVISLICAIAGLLTLRAQRPNLWQFRLTLLGLIGTSIPSFLILLAVGLSKDYFTGAVSCGAAPIITPIAMAISIFVVIRRKNKVQEELNKQLKAQGLIYRGGDL